MTQDQLKGAAREAIVKADLLLRGFEVFQAVCPNSTFDLVAHKRGVLLRVEVKGKNHAARGTSPTSSMCKTRDCRKFDIFAAVEENSNSIRYVRSALHILNDASRELVVKEVVDLSTRKDYIERIETLMKGIK